MNLKAKLTQKKEKISSRHGVFRNESGAIDLSSIMVGIIVIGLIGGVIAATVFSVIPWTQDNAAKQQLESVAAAESAYMGLSSDPSSPLPAGGVRNTFGSSALLEVAGLMRTGATYCVSTDNNGKNYTAYSQSASGKLWSISSENSKPVIHSGGVPVDCESIIPPDAPYIDVTPKLTVMTYKCDTTTTGKIPIATKVTGTEQWDDGTPANPYTNAASLKTKTLEAGKEYKVTFTGTYGSLTTDYDMAMAKCLRSLDHWGMETGATSAFGAFYGAANLTSVPKHVPATVTDMGNMFYGTTTFNSPNVSNWDVSNVTTVYRMFQNASSFNQSLNNWKLPKITSTYEMFAGASSFNQPLDNWKMSNISDMTSMFAGASSFNQPIEKWDVSGLKKAQQMFQGASSFNQPLDKWNVSKLEDAYSMFTNASSFNQPLNSWKTLSLNNTTYMFFNASNFNQDLNDWDVSKVTSMWGMFNGASKFNGDITKWNVSQVVSLSDMFYGNNVFNRDLSGWNTVSVTSGTRFAPPTFKAEYLPPKTQRY